MDSQRAAASAFGTHFAPVVQENLVAGPVDFFRQRLVCVDLVGLVTSALRESGPARLGQPVGLHFDDPAHQQ